MIELPIISPLTKSARNEQRKAIAATCNALAVAFFVSALLQPVVTGQFSLVGMIGALLGFIVLQGALHYILAKVED
jgi:hypothetical protein